MRGIFAAFCRHAYLSVKDEVSTGHVCSHPVDILVQGWGRGNHSFDIRVLSSATLKKARAADGVAAFATEFRKLATNDAKGWDGLVVMYSKCTFSQLASLLAIGQASSKAKMVSEILSILRSVDHLIWELVLYCWYTGMTLTHM